MINSAIIKKSEKRSLIIFMKNETKKVISIRLVYVILAIAIITAAIIGSLKFHSIKLAKKAEDNEQEYVKTASIDREEKAETTSRSEETVRGEEKQEETNQDIETNQTEENIEENQENENEEEKQVSETESKEENNENVESTENSEATKNTDEEVKEENEEKYISIKDVKISQDMDLTVRTGLSRDDFIKLISGVKADTSGFFKQNAGTIYDLCKEYSLNEIFFCGIISAESGWDIAQNHRSTHNYISLMSNGKLISFPSVESGLREAAKRLHTNYLTKGGKFYYGKTLAAVKTKFCPASSTWVSLVYGRMSQIVK